VNLPLLGLAALGGLVGAPLVLAPLRERLAPRELAGAQRFVRAAGYELHATDEGPPDGPVIVLIHGFASWAFCWRNQRRALADAGYRVVCVDQIGYGASERVAAPVYDTRTQSETLLAALDALGVGAFHVVGHSFGGRVAMQLAIIAPKRVRSVTAICPEAFSTGRPPVGAVVATPLLGFALAYYSLSPELAPTGLRMLTRNDAWLTPEAAHGYTAPLEVRGSILSQIWQARSPKDGAEPVPENLGRVTQPTLLLWGEQDTVFPAEDGRRLAQTLPDARLSLLPDTGHLPHEERADDVNAAILGFVGAVSLR
jgi:pimeloyl-ACP methyl ester carboxylesterase